MLEKLHFVEKMSVNTTLFCLYAFFFKLSVS